jgi:hypothetical protein
MLWRPSPIEWPRPEERAPHILDGPGAPGARSGPALTSRSPDPDGEASISGFGVWLAGQMPGAPHVARQIGPGHPPDGWEMHPD